MYPHLLSTIYHLKSCIALTAESLLCSSPLPLLLQNPIRFSQRPQRFCGSYTYFILLRILAVQLPLHFGFTQHSVLSTQHFSLTPRSRVPAAMAQIAVAAAMTEPTAALGGSSRASRMAVALFQRLLPCFPSVIAAAVLP